MRKLVSVWLYWANFVECCFLFKILETVLLKWKESRTNKNVIKKKPKRTEFLRNFGIKMKFDEWKSVIIVLIVVQLDVGLCKRIRVKRISSYAIWINYVYYFSSYYSFQKMGFNYMKLLQSLLSIRCQVSMEF